MTAKAEEEALRLQYSVRSAFFYRQRKNWQIQLSAVRKLDSSSYNWGDPAALGISRAAWSHVRACEIPACYVFCHPDVIASETSLIDYYLSICGLPKKGRQQLASVARAVTPSGDAGSPPSRAMAISQLFNTYMSALIDGDPEFSVDDALLLGAMNFGTQVNGSWRNEIGSEGERRVKELIVSDLTEKGVVTKLVARDGSSVAIEVHAPVYNVQSLFLANGYTITFGSDPDISLRSPGGALEAAVEVKAGLDRAGALERYGAAKKSFAKALSENKACTTIYLASCMTKRVKKDIAIDFLVRREFNLSEVFTEPAAKEEFLNYLRWLAHI